MDMICMRKERYQYVPTYFHLGKGIKKAHAETQSEERKPFAGTKILACHVGGDFEDNVRNNYAGHSAQLEYRRVR